MQNHAIFYVSQRHLLQINSENDFGIPVNRFAEYIMMLQHPTFKLKWLVIQQFLFMM